MDRWTYPNLSLFLICMATLKISIFKAKMLKDGRHRIRIAVCHKGVTEYIVTRFFIDDLSQFKDGRVIKRPDAEEINRKLRIMLYEYQDRLDGIKNIHSYSCKQIRAILIGYGECMVDERKTFQSVSESYINELIEEGRGNYAKLIERNCRYFTDFAKGDFLIEDITPGLIESYSKYLKRKGTMGQTTLGMMMSRTRTIINRAIKLGIASFTVHPFVNYKIKAAAPRDISLSIEAFNKIRNCQFEEKRLRVAHDLFCLSFYLGGMNLIDLLSVNFNRKDGMEIEYVRTKTRNMTDSSNMVRITVPDIAKPIINEWMNKNTGNLDFGYKLSYSNFYRHITRQLNNIAERLCIDEKVVFYSARKSFAQYASEIGITDAVINYCLGHSDHSRGIIRYYTKVRQRQAELAINRVIDYVENPDKYESIIEMNINMMMMRV